jgi:hypothetical protein
VTTRFYSPAPLGIAPQVDGVFPELLEKHVADQTLPRVEELVNIFIHATRVS